MSASHSRGPWSLNFSAKSCLRFIAKAHETQVSLCLWYQIIICSSPVIDDDSGYSVGVLWRPGWTSGQSYCWCVESEVIRLSFVSKPRASQNFTQPDFQRAATVKGQILLHTFLWCPLIG